MPPEYELLYYDMLADINRTLALPHAEKTNAESCFWIARRYSERLTRNKTFQNEEEEILFFRDVKPHFTHWIVYFVMLTEGLQFAPCTEAGRNQHAHYWQKEAQRLERYVQKYEEFIHYHEGKENNKDHLYYLRKNDQLPSRHLFPLFDEDKEMATSHEHILRGYLARKRYNEYCICKLHEYAQS